MSSNDANSQTPNNQETGGAVPLTFGQKKKSGAKPKVRVRPNLKKNSLSNKRKDVGRPSAAAAVVPSKKIAIGDEGLEKANANEVLKSASASAAVTSTETETATDENSNSQKGDDAQQIQTSTSKSAMEILGANENVNAAATETNKVAPLVRPSPASSVVKHKNTTARKIKKILPRKPIRKPIKPSRRIVPTNKKGVSMTSASSRKGLSISVGSSFPQQQRRSRLSGKESSSTMREDIPSSTEEGATAATSSSSTSASAVDPNVNTSNTQTTTTTNNNNRQGQRTYLPEEEDIIPYQHLGQIDPALNIAPPKPGEKSMKDFCTKFKIPKAERRGNKSGANAPASGTNHDDNDKGDDGDADGNGNGNGSQNPTARNADEEESQDENTMNTPRDNRSGPLVEIINGEIVIKESSMIVGGRQTTEEVDRELEGTIVVEENTGITATYNSFTKRQKTQRWTVEETRKFYMALRQCGTDFTTMENFFDGRTSSGNGKKSTKRTRKQLKSKYLREHRKNPHLIDMAMNPKVQLPLDVSVFGELDMAAVQDSVVPLGQATVSPATGVVTPATSVSPIPTPTGGVGDDVAGADEMQVIVEDAEQEHAANANANAAATAAALVTQEDAASALSEKALDAVLGVATPSALDAVTQTSMLEEEQPEIEATAGEVHNVPLLAMPTGKKKKQRPKFRARAKPKAKPKGKQAKRTVK